MTPETINMLFVGVLAAAALGAAAYFLARYLKGSIRITLRRESFSPGEQVEGSFELEAKKEINSSELTAALVATETYTERDFKGRSRRKTREIYRIGQAVEGARVYPAGYKANYNFKIALPPGHVGGGDAGLGGVMGFLSGFGRNIDWRVAVRLDAEGVDLAASHRIYVD